MAKAVRIAESAMEDTLPLMRPGMTERELASELVIQLLRSGSDPDLPFTPIVASGPNGALPHAVPTERKIQEGDLVTIDWGARFEGYVSDLTRNFAFGTVEPELTKVHEVVLQANRAAREAAKMKTTCAAIDKAARKVIEEAGYGQNFIHRTGHGIGLESHEGPYVRQDNEQPVAVGMTFTVEPGIYLPEKGGVRIEDNIAITPSTAESLSTIDRELRVVG
jgi:Xaa-Pro dipeptidase